MIPGIEWRHTGAPWASRVGARGSHPHLKDWGRSSTVNLPARYDLHHHLLTSLCGIFTPSSAHSHLRVWLIDTRFNRTCECGNILRKLFLLAIHCLPSSAVMQEHLVSRLSRGLANSRMGSQNGLCYTAIDMMRFWTPWRRRRWRGEQDECQKSLRCAESVTFEDNDVGAPSAAALSEQNKTKSSACSRSSFFEGEPQH